MADAIGHGCRDVEQQAGIGQVAAVKELIKPKAVIPMHYGINPLAKGTAAEFVEAMGSAPIRVMIPAPGASLSF